MHIIKYKSKKLRYNITKKQLYLKTWLLNYNNSMFFILLLIRIFFVH